MTVHILNYMYNNVLDIHVQTVVFYQKLKEIINYTMKALVVMLVGHDTVNVLLVCIY